MLNNLVIAYRTAAPEQPDGVIVAAIARLGEATELFPGLWYVDSSYSAEDAAASIRVLMDDRDRLVVVDTTNNELAWFNLDSPASDHLREQWHR